MSKIQDRVKGIFIGLAAGDKNGGPIRMALRLAQSLHGRNAFDVVDIGERYLAWWRQGGFDTGPVAAKVFKLADSGLSFDQAALQVHNESGGITAGCNPAHRSAPLAMLASLPDDELSAAAIAEASLTHKHPLAGDVSTATVTLCRALVRGNDWSTALRLAQRGRLSQTRVALETKPADSLSTGGFAPQVLAAAIHFISDNETFSSAIREAVRFAGPANYCPVLVGSIGGARWGESAIRSDLLGSNFELMPHISEAAENLSSDWV